MNAIKLRIFFSVFWPIVFWLGFLLYGLYLSTFRSITLASSFTIVTLLRILFLGRKYLIYLAIENGIITITYLTAFLRQKEFKATIDQSVEFLYEERNWIADEHDSLSIVGVMIRKKFQLVGRAIKAEVKRKIRVD